MKTLLLILLLASCGDSPAPADDKAQPIAAEDGEEDVKKDEKEDKTIEAVKAKTLMIATIDDAKPCTDDNASELIYVRDEASFYVCDIAWVMIYINGQDGLDGRDGVDGQDGEDSMDYSNVWIDPLYHHEWFFIGRVAYSATCPLGYERPTREQLTSAITNGIVNAAVTLDPDFTDFWISNAGSLTTTYYSMQNTTINGNPNPGVRATLVCRKS